MNLKPLDIFVLVLLIIGGLNLGLIGFFNYNFIGAIFGAATLFSRIIYVLVGLSAVYGIVQYKRMQCRICT